MRNVIIGVVIGLVVGIVLGSNVIGPNFDQRIPGLNEPATSEPVATAGDTRTHALGTPAVQRTSEGGTPVKWRMASAVSGSVPQVAELAKRLEDEMRRVSGGLVTLAFHDSDTLVPAAEMFEAVRSGTVEAAFANSAAWSAKAPAFHLFSSIPFGPSAREYLAWYYGGGGKALYQAPYNRFGIHAIICGMASTEASGWFRKPVETVEDLKGLRMRTGGLGAKVLERLGVETLDIGDTDVFVAFESGSIDAAEFSQPENDLALGVHERVGHYYFPGWHQPASLFDLMINRDDWKDMPETAKAQIETVCGDNVRHGLAANEARQFLALKTLAKEGAQLSTWSPEILAAFRQAWNDVVVEQSAADRTFAKVWQSLSRFREEYAIWRDLADPT